MAQKKLQRFADIKTFPNVLEYPADMQGQWKSFFKNPHPIVLELACGRGEYTVGLAGMYPAKNFIGVDVKGNRIYIGAKKCLEERLQNAAFLRTQIAMLPNYFAKDDVSEIWITFPDPQLRTSKAKKRLTHPAFLRLYHQILVPGGIIHLKTDSPDLYNFTRRVAELYNLHVLEDHDNLYAQTHDAALAIKTHYELLDIAGSKQIYYLKFSLPEVLAGDDSALHLLLKETENINS
jgi:tRNA (guanine-N7-)-methyltransferase